MNQPAKNNVGQSLGTKQTFNRFNAVTLIVIMTFGKSPKALLRRRKTLSAGRDEADLDEYGLTVEAKVGMNQDELDALWTATRRCFGEEIESIFRQQPLQFLTVLPNGVKNFLVILNTRLKAPPQFESVDLPKAAANLTDLRTLRKKKKTPQNAKIMATHKIELLRDSLDKCSSFGTRSWEDVFFGETDGSSDSFWD